MCVVSLMSYYSLTEVALHSVQAVMNHILTDTQSSFFTAQEGLRFTYKKSKGGIVI